MQVRSIFFVFEYHQTPHGGFTGWAVTFLASAMLVLSSSGSFADHGELRTAGVHRNSLFLWRPRE
jgi:hypothetical protein